MVYLNANVFKVSIIIPTYNVEAYITECLESVARQTYQGEMECLVVDDCGTDESIRLAEKFIQSYHGNIVFKIIHHEHNQGLSAARNTGIENAVGHYVYFLDSDDAIVPETIEAMAKIVREHPLVEMVQGGIANMEGRKVEDFTTKELPAYTEDQTWITKNILYYLPVSSWNRLLRKDFLMKNNISFHEGIIHEDVPYCFQLALKCKHIGFIRKNTYLFRPQREGSITNTPQENRALQSRIIIMHDCIDALRISHVPNRKMRNYFILFLWRKWLTYMVIHSYVVLRKNNDDVSNIISRLCSITSWPMKLIAFIYSILPIRLRNNDVFLKFSKIC